MALPRFETLVGAIDGVNVTYLTSVPYRATTVAVFLNGQLKVRTFTDGFAETSPGGGVITMNEAPRTGDVVQAYYWDTAPDTVERAICPLKGSIGVKDTLVARQRSKDGLHGKLDCKI